MLGVRLACGMALLCMPDQSFGPYCCPLLTSLNLSLEDVEWRRVGCPLAWTDYVEMQNCISVPVIDAATKQLAL
ncbi:hypothetical protein V8C86DRAFT_2613031 [Haematococcus lacustris]